VTADRVEKFREYEAGGVAEYIVVEAREGRHGFNFWRLDATGHYAEVAADDAGRYHSAVLPGLWLDPRWFERDPLPVAEELMRLVAGDAYRDWILSKFG
jgi:hypothetical protein